MSGWGNRREGELKSRGRQEDKVVVEFKDKDQFRKFSLGGRGRNIKRRLD